MLSESDDTVAISALQHFVYCSRQAALIHVERVWADNGLTVRGQIVHDRAHDPGQDQRRGVRVVRALGLRSRRLGIVGVADCVEWIRRADGKEHPRPVETKRGPVMGRRADQVQVCAQALCLEEMTGLSVDFGLLFYATSHRRVEVALGAELRQFTEEVVRRVRRLLSTGETPPPEPGPKCRRCSLVDLCQPEILSRRGNGARYLRRLYETANDPAEPG
jgi:CRISPR-associated exonuclease Cas4